MWIDVPIEIRGPRELLPFNSVLYHHNTVVEAGVGAGARSLQATTHALVAKGISVRGSQSPFDGHGLEDPRRRYSTVTVHL